MFPSTHLICIYVNQFSYGLTKLMLMLTVKIYTPERRPSTPVSLSKVCVCPYPLSVELETCEAGSACLNIATSLSYWVSLRGESMSACMGALMPGWAFLGEFTLGEFTLGEFTLGEATAAPVWMCREASRGVPGDM